MLKRNKVFLVLSVLNLAAFASAAPSVTLQLKGWNRGPVQVITDVPHVGLSFNTVGPDGKFTVSLGDPVPNYEYDFLPAEEYFTLGCKPVSGKLTFSAAQIDLRYGRFASILRARTKDGFIEFGPSALLNTTGQGSKDDLMHLTMMYSDKALKIMGKVKCSTTESDKSVYSEMTVDVSLQRGWNWLAEVRDSGKVPKAVLTTVPLDKVISIDYDESSPTAAADVFNHFESVLKKLK
ncbi:hypothetical protein [Deinococcus marmoris]|uniref:hypothetical protein n=1 Tax=Deinococcus marmoris TaxID=249408 RepID=UPI00096AB67F|nr:hypothetical protein [Deinococcus marmoris]